MCHTLVNEDYSLCPLCWSNITFLSDPYCDCCAFPFEISVNNELNICAKCNNNSYFFDKSRSCIIYDKFSKKLILQFKHNDSLYMAKLFAKWMVNSGQDILKQTDLLIPIPIHWRKLLFRKYNQAALLSNEISKIIQIPSQNNIVYRVKHTKVQSGNNANRKQNIKNVFELNEKCIRFVNKKNVTIIDDVHTSGATLNECAKVLKKYGAKQVNTMTIARVARL